MSDEVQEFYDSGGSDGKLLQLTLVYPKGHEKQFQRCYDESHIDALNKWNAHTSIPLVAIASNHCGLNLDVEELVKNSEPIT